MRRPEVIVDKSLLKLIVEKNLLNNTGGILIIIIDFSDSISGGPISRNIVLMNGKES